YNPKNQESQRVQETLFHEKQTIIEGCLFGVDINPNSVKICRLRLWIELLKNAYYKTSPLTPLLRGEGNMEELETLPNIDINIKCGNSLISRFSLDGNLQVALSKQKYSIEDYKNAVKSYRNAENKEQKREMERLINDIKGNFKTTLQGIDPNKTKLRQLEGEVENLENQIFLIPETKAEKTKREKKIAKLNNEIDKLKVEIEDIERGKIYENTIEWRFEFPEVLNDEGVFVGFDVVIGNPPYAVLEKERNTTLEPYQLILQYAKSTHRYDKIEGGKLNLYRLFIYLSYQISKCKNEISLIVPLTIVADNSLFSTRKFLLDSCFRLKLLCFPQKDIVSKRVFEDAKQSTLILMASINKKLKTNQTNILVYTYPSNSFDDNYKFFATTALEISKFDPQSLCIPLVSENEWKIINKIHQFKPIKDESNILVHRGEINQTIFRNYITSNQSHKKLVKGVEIGRYKINTVFSQGVREYFNEDAFLASKKSNHLCSIKRIATQRITGVDEKLRLVATIVDEYSYFADSTNSIHIQRDDVYSLEYILALINSRLFQWRFQKTSSNNNVSTTEIEVLPFTYSENLESKITIIVSEILNAKKSDPNADTSALEAEIDQMVYQLYNLTPEEIQIIESSNG
ncbi:Eco57I restriction-modification methylase domain-containing protein, partial [Anabaena sp. FACHB-1237]|uniref:Eco57I restriction-modification methylase domain-containing protein n=1 Tax=Anabaena sp. FACHB-1237 TaxID=2692769 RepID=UPI0016817A2A